MAATDFLYYCSLLDVKDWLFDIAFVDTDANTKFTDARLRRAISRSYAEINTALKTGNYGVPVTNSTKSLIEGAETASMSPVDIAITAGDGENFQAGDTVRIHGLATTPYNDEFAGIVKVATDTLTVDSLVNAYDAGATVELCTLGFLHLREINAQGAALKILFGKVVGQAKSRNEKIVDLRTEYKEQLDALKSHEVVLDGLTDLSHISTYQSDNPDNLSVTSQPVVTLNMEF